MAKNEKLRFAVWALDTICYSSVDRIRAILDDHIKMWGISPDDPWVAAALGCVNDADIPDIALEFFLADVKSGYFDMKVENDNSHPDPLSTQ